MKKIILSVFCLFLFFLGYPAFADNKVDNASNWGIQPVSENAQSSKKVPSSETILNQEHDETIDENYGSDQSPLFLNRENTYSDEYEENNDYDNYDPAGYVE